MQKSRHSLGAGLHHLTNRAHLAVLLDVLSDAWPPIVAPHIVRCFLWPKMPQHFVCLGYYHFSDLSFVMNGRWDTKHRHFHAITGVQEVTYDLEVLVVPEVVKDFGEKWVILIPILDTLYYRQIPFYSGAKVWEMSKGLLDHQVRGVIQWGQRRRYWVAPTCFMGSKCFCIPLPFLNSLYDWALQCK